MRVIDLTNRRTGYLSNDHWDSQYVTWHNGVKERWPSVRLTNHVVVCDKRWV